jgi:hypothetical protein
MYRQECSQVLEREKMNNRLRGHAVFFSVPKKTLQQCVIHDILWALVPIIWHVLMVFKQNEWQHFSISKFI